MCVHVCAFVCACLGGCLCVCLCACLLLVYVCVCVCVCVRVCVYVCVTELQQKSLNITYFKVRKSACLTRFIYESNSVSESLHVLSYSKFMFLVESFDSVGN